MAPSVVSKQLTLVICAFDCNAGVTVTSYKKGSPSQELLVGVIT